MLVLVVHNRVKPGLESQVRSLFLQLEAASRKEPGCRFYAVQQGKDDPREFLVYEQYTDSAALEAHRATPHFQQFAPKIASACETQSRNLYQTLSGDSTGSETELIAD